MVKSPSNVTRSLRNKYFESYPAEAARILNELDPAEILLTLKSEKIDTASLIYVSLEPGVASELIPNMDDDFFKSLLSEIDPGVGTKILSRLDREYIDDRLSLLPSKISAEINELLSYPLETAGYFMDTKVVYFYPDDTIEVTLKKIRAIGDRRILNIHVVDDDQILVGIVRLQEVAISQPHQVLRELIDEVPNFVEPFTPKEDIIKLLDEKKLVSLPVVDLDRKLLGIIRYEALVNAVRQDASEDVQAMFGAGRDERALSTAFFSIRKRLPWLQINLVTAFLAASVVGLFEDTIAKITVLAVFLPVVAGQSGNTGSQALAVTIRGLALREIRLRHWFKVTRKEIMVGFVNGVVVALSTAIVVFFWADSFGLAVVIAVAMVFSMVIAGFSGAIIPIILTTLGQDPAQSSSIILTTVTDVAGFLSFLGLATLLANILQIV